MTIEECYQETGGNCAEVRARLPSPAMIEKFIVRFLEDRSFETLCNELQAGNRSAVFRAAHTLKGVCANLSFSRLMDSAGRLTEVLRPVTGTIPDAAIALLEDVRQDYQVTVGAIRRCHGAVLWTAGEDIHVSTSSTAFRPETTCIRAQIVTFLYHAGRSS